MTPMWANYKYQKYIPLIMVFLKEVTSEEGVPYYYIVMSVREGRKVYTQTLRKLGPLGPQEAEWWRTLLKGHSSSESGPFLFKPEDIENSRSLRHGIVVVGHALWQQLGLDKIILESFSRTSSKLKMTKLTEIMVLNRLEEPKSDLALVSWFPRTSLPFLLKLRADCLYDNLFYRTLTNLWKRRDIIEKKIWEEIVKPRTAGETLGKDMTSSYFEGRGPPMAAKGYSRDKRRDCKQVNWGLVVTEEGYPITLEVYPGNVPDKKTVVGTCERLKNVFGVTKAIFVGDRATTTEDNLKEITLQGYDYVVAETNSNVREVLEAAKKMTFQDWTEPIKWNELLPGYEKSPDEQLKGMDVEVDGQRYVVAWSSHKERDDLSTLEKNLTKGKNTIQRVAKYSREHPNVDHHEILQMASRDLEKIHVSTYFKINWDEKKGLVHTSTDKVEFDRKYAGMWVLRTSRKEIDGKNVVKIYKGLQRLEEAFREIKDVLMVRPIGHRRDDHTEVHIWICVLAYLLEKIAEEKVRQNNVELTGHGVFETFREIRLNEEGLKGTERRWWTVTKLTMHCEQVLDALNLDTKIFNVNQRLLSGG